MAVLPWFFQRLKLLVDSGAVQDIIVSADSTFRAEPGNADMVYCVLNGRWRKSGWPLVLARNSRESHAIDAEVSRHSDVSLQGEGCPCLASVI